MYINKRFLRLLLVLFAFSPFCVVGQDEDRYAYFMLKVNDFILEKDYEMAHQFIDSIIKTEGRTLENLQVKARIYLLQEDYGVAYPIYRYLAKKKKSRLHLYYKGYCEIRLKKYPSLDTTAKLYEAMQHNVNDLYVDAFREVFPLSVELTKEQRLASRQEEYGLRTLDDKIYFVRKHPRESESYIVKTEKGRNGRLDRPEPADILSGKKSKSYGAFAFSKDGEWLLVTQAGRKALRFPDKSLIFDKVLEYPPLRVFPSIIRVYKKEGQKWAYKREFDFNGVAYSVAHPTFSEDGKTLYFSSNMPNGYGGSDIWKCEFSTEDGSVSNLRNMGPLVNTFASENFPMMRDNVLFYSSNKSAYDRSFDIFAYNIELEKDYVLDLPFNSLQNDISFYMKKNWKEAYFSSNRESTTDDIYKVMGDMSPLKEKADNLELANPNIGGEEGVVSSENAPESKEALLEEQSGAQENSPKQSAGNMTATQTAIVTSSASNERNMVKESDIPIALTGAMASIFGATQRGDIIRIPLIARKFQFPIGSQALLPTDLTSMNDIEAIMKAFPLLNIKVVSSVTTGDYETYISDAANPRAFAIAKALTTKISNTQRVVYHGITSTCGGRNVPCKYVDAKGSAHTEFWITNEKDELIQSIQIKKGGQVYEIYVDNSRFSENCFYTVQLMYLSRVLPQKEYYPTFRTEENVFTHPQNIGFHIYCIKDFETIDEAKAYLEAHPILKQRFGAFVKKLCF